MGYNYKKYKTGSYEKFFKIFTKKDWLYSRGGRTVEDVHSDTGGEYVTMQYGNEGLAKVYIPHEYKD